MTETSVDPVELTAVDEARLLYERAVWDYWKDDPTPALETAVDFAFDRLRAAILASDPRVQALEVVARAAATPAHNKWCAKWDYEPCDCQTAPLLVALAALQEVTGRGEDGDG